jgi:hypothetical protein
MKVKLVRKWENEIKTRWTEWAQSIFHCKHFQTNIKHEFDFKLARKRVK